MRKLAILAIVGMLAAPAMADMPEFITAGTVPMGGGTGNTVGSLDGAGFIRSSTYPIAGTTSDAIVVQFGFHWPYTGPDPLHQIQYNVYYDNSEVMITGVSALAPIAFVAHEGHYATPADFPNPTSGSVAVSLWGNPTDTTALQFVGSSTYAFVQLTLHVKGPDGPTISYWPDPQADLFISAFAALVSHIATGAYPPYTSNWWSANLTPPGYGINVIPEPATLSLLALGFVSVGAGVWRRRR